jgi:ABC-type multidrug transport system fused ATPase/permease subunit
MVHQPLLRRGAQRRPSTISPRFTISSRTPPSRPQGAACTPIFALIYLFALDWRLALLSVIPLPIYALAYAYMAKDWGAMQVKVNAMIQQISEAAIEFVSGISVVKTFGKDRSGA